LGRFGDDEVVVSGDGEALTLRWVEERFGESSSCSSTIVTVILDVGWEGSMTMRLLSPVTERR